MHAIADTSLTAYHAHINRCAERAERHAPGFTDTASACVLSLLRERGAAPGELLVDLCKLRGHVPPDDRAFGYVFRTLSKAGAIRQVGYCLRRKGHSGSGGRVWSLA